MVRVIGDIWPAASGSSSLGVDQTGCCPIGDEIRPFNHIHMNSGVWHDPMHGSSGVVRFNGKDESAASSTQSPAQIPSLELSFDGGKTFDARLGQAVTADGKGSNGNVVLQSLNDKRLQVSGSGELLLTSETDVEVSTRNGALNLETLVGNISIQAGEDLSAVAQDQMLFVANNDINFACLLDSADATWSANRGDATVQAGTASRVGGQVQLKPFTGSGVLEYRFGPHQAWYAKTSHTSTGGPDGDGYFPLPHSGQITQMIAEGGGGGIVDSLAGSDGGGTTADADIVLSNGGGINIQTIASDELEFINTGTLQRAYNNGETIFIDSAGGGTQDLQFVAGSHKLKLSTDGDRAEISMSGQLTIPSTDLETGDMTMLVHGVDTGHGSITVPTTLAESQALSLGIGKPMINTGSGIVPVMVASGISSFFNVGTQTLTASAINVNFTANQVPDGHFVLDANDDILIMVPGLYKATYAASCVKTAGTTRQQVDAQLEINGNLIFGSLAHGYLRNATNENAGTANGLALFDANAGDVFSMVVVLTNSPLGNTVTTENRAANVVLEYMGPKRGMITVSP